MFYEEILRPFTNEEEEMPGEGEEETEGEGEEEIGEEAE
jgi:hypothetical protein